MKVLIIGGTVFLGRALVESALDRGHEVTLFNRGQHNPNLYPDVERIRGDRATDLGTLEGRHWDAVIDTCGYVPRITRLSAQALRESVDLYAFISTLSVYPDFTVMGIDEETPVGTLDDPTTEEITGQTYGPLKALAEAAIEEVMPGRTLIIRPGLIVGPHDQSDRFTYWPVRVARGGDVVAPGRPERTVQFVDVRDLADFTLTLVERGATGIYNVNGPETPVAMGPLLETMRAVSGSDARFVWVDDETLGREGVGAWVEMPLWFPEEQMPGFFAFDIRKARAAGLTFRPLADTIRATLDWALTRPGGYEPRAGLAPEKEVAILTRR